jgi:hypothetical protein
MEANQWPAVSTLKSRDAQICDLLGYNLGPHPMRKGELAVFWTFRVCVGPEQGKLIRVTTPPTLGAWREMAKAHLPKGAFGDGADTSLETLKNRQSAVKFQNGYATVERLEHDLDRPVLHPSEVIEDPDQPKNWREQRWARSR